MAGTEMRGSYFHDMKFSRAGTVVWKNFGVVLLHAGVGVKVYLVDMTEECISPPFTLRVYLQQTVAALKDQVASHLSCDVDHVYCVLDVHSDLRLLDEPERSLKLVGFGKNNKVCWEFVVTACWHCMSILNCNIGEVSVLAPPGHNKSKSKEDEFL